MHLGQGKVVVVEKVCNLLWKVLYYFARDRSTSIIIYLTEEF